MKRKGFFLAGCCVLLTLIVLLSVAKLQAGESSFIVVKEDMSRSMPQYDLRVRLNNNQSVIYKKVSFWNPSLANELLKIEGVEWVRFENYTIILSCGDAYCSQEIDKKFVEILKKHFSVDEVVMFNSLDKDLNQKIFIAVK